MVNLRGDFLIIGDDGRFRSSKMQRLAEIFEDYDPELELQWIPPEHRTNDHAPTYRLVHHSSKHGSYVVGTFYEYDDPEQVWIRFRMGDTRRTNVLAQLDAMERANDAWRIKEWIDGEEERKDLTRFFFDYQKNYITMRDYRGDKVKYDDRGRKRRV